MVRHQVALSSALAPPVIDPSTGMYRPPLLVAISPAPVDLAAALHGGGGYDDDSQRDVGVDIYFTVHQSTSAADVSSAGAASVEPPPRLYAGSFTLSQVGRVRVRAFMRRTLSNGEVIDGPSATALFLLDRLAAPPRRAEHGRHMHLVRSPAPAVNVSTLKAAMANASLDTNQVVASNKRFLQFVELPRVVSNFETFSLTMFLVDGCGFPVALPDSDPTVCLAAEVRSISSSSSSNQLHGTRHEVVEGTVLRVPAAALPADNAALPIQWAGTTNVLSCGRGSLHRVGESTSWDAWALGRPTITLAGEHVGVRVTVANACRCIVGLHTADVDPTTRAAWRQFAHSIHFSADGSSSSGGAGAFASRQFFRLYDGGELVEEVGTQPFNLGATFEIKIRPNGVVVYSVDGCVIHLSPQRYLPRPEAPLLAVSVKLASQQAEPALSFVGLVRAETPSLVSVKSLMWRSSPVVEHSKDSEARRIQEELRRATRGDGAAEGGPTKELVLRGWIAGADHVPATAAIPFEEKAMPRWAVGAVSLAAMFALGTFGCQAGHVSRTLLAPRPPGLVVVEGDAAPAVVGNWLSPSAAARMPLDRHRIEQAAAVSRQHQHQQQQPPPARPVPPSRAVPREDLDIVSPKPLPGYAAATTPRGDHRRAAAIDDEADTPESARPLGNLRDFLRSRGF